MLCCPPGTGGGLSLLLCQLLRRWSTIAWQHMTFNGSPFFVYLSNEHCILSVRKGKHFALRNTLHLRLGPSLPGTSLISKSRIFLLRFYSWRPVTGRMMSPEDIHSVVTRTCEYVHQFASSLLLEMREVKNMEKVLKCVLELSCSIARLVWSLAEVGAEPEFGLLIAASSRKWGGVSRKDLGAIDQVLGVSVPHTLKRSDWSIGHWPMPQETFPDSSQVLQLRVLFCPPSQQI